MRPWMCRDLCSGTGGCVFAGLDAFRIADRSMHFLRTIGVGGSSGDRRPSLYHLQGLFEVGRRRIVRSEGVKWSGKEASLEVVCDPAGMLASPKDRREDID